MRTIRNVRFYLEKVSCPLSFLCNFIFEIALILLELFTTIILFYKINNNPLPAEAKKTIVFFVFFVILRKCLSNLLCLYCIKIKIKTFKYVIYYLNILLHICNNLFK